MFDYIDMHMTNDVLLHSEQFDVMLAIAFD